MTKKKLDWQPDLTFPVGKGATMQRFTSREGQDELEIETTPWGEGDLKVNESPVAHVSDDADAGEAFRDLETIAELYEEERAEPAAKGTGKPLDPSN